MFFHTKNYITNGYYLANFEDTFSRYLPAPPSQNSTTLQANNDKACSPFQNSTDTNSVEFQTSPKASTGKACRVVEFQKGAKSNIDAEKVLIKYFFHPLIRPFVLQ